MRKRQRKRGRKIGGRGREENQLAIIDFIGFVEEGDRFNKDRSHTNQSLDRRTEQQRRTTMLSARRPTPSFPLLSLHLQSSSTFLLWYRSYCSGAQKSSSFHLSLFRSRRINNGDQSVGRSLARKRSIGAQWCCFDDEILFKWRWGLLLFRFGKKRYCLMCSQIILRNSLLTKYSKTSER